MCIASYLRQAERVFLKRPHIIETMAFPRIGYALITGKMQVKLIFVQYMNFNKLFLT